jgi:hypothetical protein
MKIYLQLALSLAALIAYATFVSAVYSYARAKTVNEACGVDCLMQRVDALNEKTAEQLTAVVGKSIKSGQTVTLHTQAGAGGGCLTFIGPSGDRGGYVPGMQIALTAPCGRFISEYGPKVPAIFQCCVS